MDSGLEFRVRVLGLGMLGLRVYGSGFRVRRSGFRVSDSRCRVQGLGSRVQDRYVPPFAISGARNAGVPTAVVPIAALTWV